MSGYFTLELDTNGPIIEIYTPAYTTPDIETEIIVQSNEVLSNYQEIYIIDVDNNRHDVIFTNMGDYYLGRINFNNFGLGIVTIYARLKDEVDNLSNLASKSLLILEKGFFNIEIGLSTFTSKDNVIEKPITLKNTIKSVYDNIRTKEINDTLLTKILEDRITNE